MPPEEEPKATELRDYLYVLRRRRTALMLCILVVVAAAMIASYLQTPVYAASAEILLQRKTAESLFDPNSGQYTDPQRVIQTEIRVLMSQPIHDAARQALGYSGRISASAAGLTDIIIVRAEDVRPKNAADIANAYANAYIEFKRKQSVEDVLAAATEVQAKISDLQTQINNTASDPIRETLVQQQALFKNTLDELQVNATLQSGGAQLTSRAQVPTTPFEPRPLRNAMVALVFGGLFGIAAAFLLEYLDDSIKTKDDLERAAPSLAVMSLIPASGTWKGNQEPRVVSIAEPSSASAEAYRTLRTGIQFLGVDRPVRAVQVTSANAQEGKTTTLANLGVALARAGSRVVIVCSDLRRPRIHEFFGLDNKVGFTSVLLGEVPLANALQKVPNVDRLFVLASGPLPPNPSELLQSRRAAEILHHLQAEGNFLLIDSPPILPVTDGLVLSKRVDGTLLVCAAGRTSRKEVARAVEMLRQVEAPIIGSVLNGVKADASYGYTYEYYRSEYSANGNGAAKNGKNGSSSKRKRAKRAAAAKVE